VLSGCGRPKVELSLGEELKLGDVATLRPPKGFLPFEGETRVDPEDENFWAVTHVLGFGEDAVLAISRVADQQSFTPAQTLYEIAAQKSNAGRWRATKRLNWRSSNKLKGQTLFEAEIEPGPKGAGVWGLNDRETLLQVLILGDRQVLEPAVAPAVLDLVKQEYRLRVQLEDQFGKLTREVQARAEARRAPYLRLLETLQREELDYTPTPRVVIFNRNLAGQFWWPRFDRSGVPSHFTIAGRLGKLESEDRDLWQKLEEFFPGTRLVAAKPAGEDWDWVGLATEGQIGRRMQALLVDTRWANPEESQAFAVFEISFGAGPADLSEWLTALESIGKQAERLGLVFVQKGI